MSDASRPRILIVDDEENIRHLLRLAFEDEFEVVEAADGQEALDKALEFRPRIILSDIMMPRLDGYGLYRKVKSRPETASIPFVFLSAKKDVDERVVGLEMGADDYITKPFSIKELKAKVRSIAKKISDMKELGSLEGLIKEVDLVDVIQLIEMSRKTGMLLVESTWGEGKVYFEQGLPVYAKAVKWTGIEAFNTMLTWKEGRFKLDQKALDIEHNIEKGGGQELLMEGVRLSDEMLESLRELPPLETAFTPSADLTVPGGEMAQVVGAFSGGASISTAMARAVVPPYRFYPLVVQALKKGLLSGRSDSQVKVEMLRKVRQALEKL